MRRNWRAGASGLSWAALAALACGASSAWMPLSAQSPLLHLDLNLPAYRLDVFLRHERVRSYRVMIGARGTQTPRGVFAISRLEWNPGRQRSTRACAANERISPADPKASAAKVRLPLSASLFIEGAAPVEAPGSATSRGCIGLRSNDAIDLASLIQRSMVGTVASDSLLAIVLSGARPLEVKLHESVPIDIRYEPLEVLAETLFAYPDPYRLGKSPWKDAPSTLARAGLDTTMIDRSRLRRMTRYPERLPVALRVGR